MKVTRTNSLIPPNLPAGDSLTTTQRLKHALTMCNTYCFSTAKMVARKRLYTILHEISVSFLTSVNFGGRDRADGIASGESDYPTIESLQGRYFPHPFGPTLGPTMPSVQ
jgi:hypothetical protein